MKTVPAGPLIVSLRFPLMPGSEIVLLSILPKSITTSTGPFAEVKVVSFASLPAVALALTVFFASGAGFFSSAAGAASSSLLGLKGEESSFLRLIIYAP